MHIMKCLFRENFIVFIGGFYLICMTTCAYCLRIVESQFDGRFLNILNCMWFTLLSMTTIGYGDFFVVTPIGIALDGFLMFSGVVIVSLLVSSLNGLFTLGYSNFCLINRIKARTNTIKATQGQGIAERNSCRIYCTLHIASMVIKEDGQKNLSIIRIANIVQNV